MSQPVLQEARPVPADHIRRWGAACLQALNMPAADAQLLADSLVQTSLWNGLQANSWRNIKMDSMLVVNHLNGTWKARNKNILPYYNDVVNFFRSNGKYKSITHVLRHLNERADELSNIGADGIDTEYFKDGE